MVVRRIFCAARRDFAADANHAEERDAVAMSLDVTGFSRAG
jgi:hypothetical protein